MPSHRTLIRIAVCVGAAGLAAWILVGLLRTTADPRTDISRDIPRVASAIAETLPSGPSVRAGDFSARNGPAITLATKLPVSASAATAAEAAFAAVLTDTSLSNHDTGLKLLRMAADSATSKIIRFEALQHGLNLIDSESFAEAVATPLLLDPSTPVEMLQVIWDDLFDRDDPDLIEINARQLADLEGHPLQEEADEWLAEFAPEPDK